MYVSIGVIIYESNGIVIYMTIIIESYLIYDTYIIIPIDSYTIYESNKNPPWNYNIYESIPIIIYE